MQPGSTTYILAKMEKDAMNSGKGSQYYIIDYSIPSYGVHHPQAMKKQMNDNSITKRLHDEGYVGPVMIGYWKEGEDPQEELDAVNDKLQRGGWLRSHELQLKEKKKSLETLISILNSEDILEEASDPKFDFHTPDKSILGLPIDPSPGYLSGGEHRRAAAAAKAAYGTAHDPKTPPQTSTQSLGPAPSYTPNPRGSGIQPLPQGNTHTRLPREKDSPRNSRPSGLAQAVRGVFGKEKADPFSTPSISQSGIDSTPTVDTRGKRKHNAYGAASNRWKKSVTKSKNNANFSDRVTNAGNIAADALRNAGYEVGPDGKVRKIPKK